MKRILGSLLLLSLSLWAKSTYVWDIHLSKKQIYLHQSTILTMQCRFDKDGKNDEIEFIPPVDSGFEFKLLSETKQFEGEIQIIRYEYLLFAKKEGEIKLKLEPTMLFTTQSAINNVIIGRDNVNDLEMQKERAKIDPVEITVLPTTSAFTGRLHMDVQNDITVASAYEPVHLEIAITGEGNLQELPDIHFEIEGVEVFSDEAEKEFSLSENGYSGTWRQRFAFVSQDDFVIPSISIRYFDLQSQAEKTLTSEAVSVKIDKEAIKREDLVDEVELPSQKIDITRYVGYLYYLLAFVSGFVVAKLVRFPQRTDKKEKGEKLKEAKTAKELLERMIVCDKELFASEIKALERAVYKGDDVVFSKIKKSALAKL